MPKVIVVIEDAPDGKNESLILLDGSPVTSTLTLSPVVLVKANVAVVDAWATEANSIKLKTNVEKHRIFLFIPLDILFIILFFNPSRYLDIMNI